MEFCKLAHGIWQNLLRKTVGPTDKDKMPSIRNHLDRLFLHSIVVQGEAKKVAPKVFCRFSATAWNFNMEFHRFIYRNVLHLTAKRNMILLKNNEITDF